MPHLFLDHVAKEEKDQHIVKQMLHVRMQKHCSQHPVVFPVSHNRIKIQISQRKQLLPRQRADKKHGNIHDNKRSADKSQVSPPLQSNHLTASISYGNSVSQEICFVIP